MKNVSTRELEVAAMVAVYIRESEFAFVNPARLLIYLLDSAPADTTDEEIIRSVIYYFEHADEFDYDALIGGECDG